MDAFLVIQRRKTTMVTGAEESSTVFQLKCVVEGILQRPPDSGCVRTTNSWMMARPWATVASPAKQYAHRPSHNGTGLPGRADDAFETRCTEPAPAHPSGPT
ncbi:hypothetical protein P7K49_012344 [Saguinus oedipus]|uniref:Uncharacterized protein n=1 Tax=Saguinus oedipus TaxID=9490 RepID=A0ABQ9VWS9_SAGOE|nr:hypothetical protein P7K49_012344 [Saguinus oedipus]